MPKEEVHITVEFVGVLHEVFKKKQTRLKFTQSPTVNETIIKLAKTSPIANRNLLDIESNQLHPALLILVNGKEISALNGAETRLKDGDKVVLISVSHGG
ncbi:MAG: MoaD/ThiS family protein [Candidatus Bathyarchaeia archaeon]